ncbi:MAG: hypothetical protein KDA61_22145, partial [Planctomycetales bacterium]|nr:hypothetical protein [Planctomycetales bacterium]
YGQYLMRKYGGARARLDYAEHLLLSPRQVLDGVALNASFTFREIDSVEVQADLTPRLEATERLPGVSP